jgi:hypothetical protein
MHYLDFLLPVAAAVLSLGDWITNNAGTLAIVVAAMGGVSGILEPIKKFLKLSDTKLVDYIKVLRFVPGIKNFSTVDVIHYGFAVLLAGAHYIQGSHSTNPVIILLQAFVVIGGNKFIYPAFVKPISDTLSDAKAEANVRRAQESAARIASEFQG